MYIQLYFPMPFDLEFLYKTETQSKISLRLATGEFAITIFKCFKSDQTDV